MQRNALLNQSLTTTTIEIMSSYTHRAAIQNAMILNPYSSQHLPPWIESHIKTPFVSPRQFRRFTLPEEISESIIKEVASSSDGGEKPLLLTSKGEIHTLFNLSLVSKAMNRITEPILYRTYTTQSNDPQIFLTALLARPHRVGYVRELIISPMSSTIFSPDPFDHLANIRMLEMDHTISGIVHACTALEALDITICAEYPGSWTQHTISKIAAQDYNGPLRSTLKRVVYRSCSKNCECCPDPNILNQFPYVEEIEFHGIDLESTAERLEKIQQGGDFLRRTPPRNRHGSSVKSLHLSKCCLGEGQYLGMLLFGWPMLDSLTMVWDGGMMDFNLVSRALVRHCPRLESLRIDTRRYAVGSDCRTGPDSFHERLQTFNHTGSSEGFCETFDSLHSLHKLRSLTMGSAALLGRNVRSDVLEMPGESVLESLPASVQHLVILRHAGLLRRAEAYLRAQKVEDRLVQEILCSARVMEINKVEVLDVDGTLEERR